MVRICLFIGLLGVWAPQQVLATALSQDEETISLCIRTLHDRREPMRQEAARVLRRIVRRYPSKTVNLRWRDGGQAFWHEKVSRIKMGMDIKEAGRILLNPEFDFIGSMNGGFGSGAAAMAQLDGHWAVSIPVNSFIVGHSVGYTVLGRAKLIIFDKPIDVRSPVRYSGHWTTWCANGQKWFEADYLNGEYNGVVTSYLSGRPSRRTSYKKGVQDGLAEEWHRDSNGRMELRESFRNGKLHGRSRRWYSNGRKDSEWRFKESKMDGLGVSWHENGRLRSTGSFREDKPVGHQIEWWENGHKRSDEFWDSIGSNGIQFLWSESGVLISRLKYHNGNAEPMDIRAAP